MASEMFMLAEKIRRLREAKGLTQAELSKALGLTRSSINSWEMGLSVPSTQYIVELAKIFAVSTDYLFGLDDTAGIKVGGLTEKEVAAVTEIVDCLRSRREKEM